MKIGLLGYGKMGKTIERIALERGHTVVGKISSTSSEADWNNLLQADVVIEFTRPESALTNFEFCLKNQLPLVTGTTGWYDHMDAARELQNQHEGQFFWASNFSIGVNLFWQINQKLAKLMNEYPAYRVSMEEIHHTQKLDEPSGTAITTAEQIIAESDKLQNWKLDTDNPNSAELPITAIREGDVKGTHIVRYESDIDRISFGHEAKTRDGFALGSVLAAEFLAKQAPGFYTMSDLIS